MPARPTDNALTHRLGLLAAILVVEALALAQLPHRWFAPQQILAAPIVFAAALAFFGRKRLQMVGLEPVDWGFVALHFVALGAVGASEFRLLHGGVTVFAQVGWYVSLVVLMVSLVVAMFRWVRLVGFAKELGVAWLYAGMVTAAAMAARALARSSWDSANSGFGRWLQQATFAGVRGILGLFYAPVISIPARGILGTLRFHVEVAGACSGIEGLGLMLVLTVGWLVYARREVRLLRAVWLVPVSLATVWLLNLCRIAALIAIGDAGHPGIASNGFHSEAGWILFNLVAITFLIAAQHVEWFRREAAHGEAAEKPLTDAETANAYLLPFLAIVAASLVTQALSSGFEVLYPLRLLVALGVLWHFRGVYRRLSWRVSWLGPAAGVIVFVVWIAVAHVVYNPEPPDKIAAGLTQLAPWQRLLWLASRGFAAVVTVPIAEELAFRGYLARRFVSAHVGQVGYEQLTLPAILFSSMLFGILHGKLALAGFVAGLAFAWVARRRGALSEAIVAHATSNLLLTVWVLGTHNYWLW